MLQFVQLSFNFNVHRTLNHASFLSKLRLQTQFSILWLWLNCQLTLSGSKTVVSCSLASKLTCEGDVPPLDLPKSNTDLYTEQVTKSYRPSNGQQIPLQGAGIFTCTYKQICENPLLYLFVLVNLRKCHLRSVDTNLTWLSLLDVQTFLHTQMATWVWQSDNERYVK
jgi:hypothetical protein